MKRLIGQYRAKVLYNGNHYHSGAWVKGYYLENIHGESFIVDTEEDFFGNASFVKVQVDPETVGELLSIPDYDNKPMYEGDTVSVEISGIGQVKHGKNQVWTIEYCDHLTYSGFRCYGADRRFNIKLTHSTASNNKMRVVGTIHDKESTIDE